MSRNTDPAAADDADRPPPLQPVPDIDHVPDVVDAIAEKLATDEQDRLHPETVLVGVLMYQPADHVTRLLQYVRDDDVEKLLPQTVLTVIRALASRGIDPDPMAVAAYLRDPTSVEVGPVEIDDFPNRQQRLVRYIVNAATDSVGITGPRSAARQVVEDAYRRAFAEIGTRIAQMAEAFADPEVLEETWRAGRDRLAAMWQRKRILSRPLPDSPDEDDDAPEPPAPDHEENPAQ